MLAFRRGSHYICIFAMALGLTACLDHETVDGEVTPQVQTLATFEGNTSDGARFSYIAQGDGPIVDLQAQVLVDTVSMHAGDRVLLTYVPRDSEGKISLLSAIRVNNGVIQRKDAKTLQGWDSDPLFVESMWRTGRYLNLRCKLLWAPEPRRYNLEVDTNAIFCDIPDVYVAHEISDSTNRSTAYMASNFASFDISALWDSPGVRGIKVHVNNSNLTDKTEFIFMK